jgi:MFS family permease
MGKAATDSILVTKDQSSEMLSEEGKKTLLAAFFGFTVDMIDVYLPIIALAPAMVYFQPADLSPTVATTLYFLVFVLSLIGRPIGSMIFGYYGDKIGRRKTTLVSILGIAVSTLLIALLPGYAAWVLGGIITMAILRLFAGILWEASIRQRILWLWNTHPSKSVDCLADLSMPAFQLERLSYPL